MNDTRRCAFSWGSMGRCDPKPYHGDLAILLLIDGNAFTLQLLEDFLQRFDLQRTETPGPQTFLFAC